MSAFFLSVGLVAYWALVGAALLSVAGLRRDKPPAMLLVAPAIGMAAVVVPLYWLDRLGVPVNAAATPLIVVSIIGAVALLRWRTTVTTASLREYAGFAVVLVAAMAFAGWALFAFGFDWLSFANDDMSNYVLGADRLARSSLLAMPNLQALKDGSDVPSIFWTLQAVVGARIGSELTLAWLAASTGLGGIQVAMPTMLALHAALISAAAALVLAESGSRRAALVTAVLVGINPLTVFAMLSQLFAQVGGLALTLGCLVLMRAPWDVPRGEGVRYVLPAAFALTALLIWYPEICPFLGLGFLVHVAVSFTKWRRESLRIAVLGLGLAAATAVCAGPYLPNAINFLWIQFSGALPAGGPRQIVFSYYFDPTGFPTFWGLQPIAIFLSPRLETVAVTAGALATIAALIVIGASLRIGRASACVAAVMAAVAVVLFVKSADFGLFKLAMYIQPPLIAATVAFAALEMRGRTLSLRYRTGLAAVACLLLLVQVRTTFFYTRMASDTTKEGYYFTLKGGTPIHLVSQMRRLIPSSTSESFATDAQSVTLAKMVSHFTRGRPLHFLSASPFAHLLGQDYPPGSQEAKLHDDFVNSITYGHFVWPDSGGADEMRFFPADRINHDRFTLIRTPRTFSVLNGYAWHGDPTTVALIPNGSLKNYLVFKPSTLGNDFFATTDFDHVAFWPVEPDYFYAGGQVAAAGRYMLFRVLNPQPDSRVMIELTDSQHPNGRTDLPPASAVGDRVVRFDAVGRGSARLVSQPVGTRTVLGENFLGIDLGRPPDAAVSRGDPRKLVAMVRDISLLTDAEYRQFQPPREISRFPADLANRQLEYSGLYEDGWLSERAFFRLAGSADSVTLHLDIEIPRLGPGSSQRELTVLADGQPVLRRSLEPGRYWLRAPLPPAPHTRRIDLEFTATEPLPNGDGRPVSARLLRLGWAPVEPFPSQLVVGRDSFDALDIDPVGLYTDGWVARAAALTLAGGGPAHLQIKGLVPLIGGKRDYRTALTVTVNGEQVARRELAVGQVDVDIPLPASAGPRRIGLAFSDVQRLSAQDAREAAMRLDRIEIASQGAPMPQRTP